MGRFGRSSGCLRHPRQPVRLCLPKALTRPDFTRNPVSNHFAQPFHCLGAPVLYLIAAILIALLAF